MVQFKRLVACIEVVMVQLIFFTAMRLFLFYKYMDSYFSDLNFNEIIYSLIAGIQFDLSIVGTFYALPCLWILFAPSKWMKPTLTLFLSLFLMFLSLLCFVALAGDAIYFGTAGRHMTDEILTVANDADMFFILAFGQYLPITICIMLSAAYLTKRNYHNFQKSFKHSPNYSIGLVWIVMHFIAIRGFSAKSLNIPDAFVIPKSSSGQLVLNGLFSTWHTIRSMEDVKYTIYNDEKLKKVLANKLNLEKQYPFYHSHWTAKNNYKRPNIIIFLLESWQPYYIDGFNQVSRELTPNFEALAKQGLRFNQFYAGGGRSIEAIQSILTSFPPLKGIPTLSMGFEGLGISHIGRSLKEIGYTTYFSQSANKNSFRLSSSATALGFEHTFGQEDYPRLIDYASSPPLFGWDHEHFQALKNEFDHASKPFFSFVFSGTSHTPFVLPPDPFHKNGHQEANEIGFENTIHYSDWALGEFMKKARESKWFEDTLFVFTADHTYPAFRKFDFYERYRIPLLFYSPKYISPGINDALGSHIDLLPTVFDYLNLRPNWAYAGDSLFSSKEQDKFAFLSGRFDTPGLITKDGYIRHNFKKLLDYKVTSNCTKECINQNVEFLMGFSQALYMSIKEKRWNPPKFNSLQSNADPGKKPL